MLLNTKNFNIGLQTLQVCCYEIDEASEKRNFEKKAFSSILDFGHPPPNYVIKDKPIKVIST